jgi:hypothetical protein
MSAQLRLGPMLRRVTATAASIWLETDAPATVTVTAGQGGDRRVAESATATVHGHHYAVVEVDGLEPGAVAAYTVQVDGAPAWPPPGGWCCCPP